jgi:hypothetical protein
MRYLWCCAGVHGSQLDGTVPLYHHHNADQASFLLASLAVCATSLASMHQSSERQCVNLDDFWDFWSLELPFFGNQFF